MLQDKMQGRKNEDDTKRYIPRKSSRHTHGKPRGSVLDSSSRGRLPSAIGGRSTTMMNAVGAPPSSPPHCVFAVPSSLCPFSKKMAGSNVDEDEATGARGLNRRSSSSLRSGSRVKFRLETRATTGGPLHSNRHNASTPRVHIPQFQLNPRLQFVSNCREDDESFPCLKRITTARFDLKVRRPVR